MGGQDHFDGVELANKSSGGHGGHGHHEEVATKICISSSTNSKLLLFSR
jgi:hypothetical protein